MCAVYILHFLRPISAKNAAMHYTGYAKDIDTRIAEHRNGTSRARLMEVARERGIDFVVAKVWKNGDRKFERKLKSHRNARRYCPICSEKPREFKG